MMLPDNFSSSSSSSSSSSTQSSLTTSHSSSSPTTTSFTPPDTQVKQKTKRQHRRSTFAILLPLLVGVSCFGATVINQRRLQTYYNSYPLQLLPSSTSQLSVFITDQDLVGEGIPEEEVEWETVGDHQQSQQQQEGGGSGGGGGVGACLLIKDDNHWLVEWLAFHYHVMPLRHLVVVVDPKSKTSPLNILRRWTDDPHLMTIDVWEDSDFMPRSPSKSMLKKYGNNTNLMDHRLRQGTFYTKCLEHYKRTRLGVSWVYLTDTDEFTSLNYNHEPKKSSSKKLLRSSSSSKTTTTVAQKLIQQYPIQQPGSVLAFLKDHQQQTSQVQKCLYLNRYMVGSAESSPQLVGKYATTTPKNTDAKDFLTQRFLKHKPKHSPYGKNMIHLDAMMDAQDIMARPDVHRVSKHCPNTEDSLGLESSRWVKINHYIGTPEQFFFRTDPRATKGKGTAVNWQRDSSHYDRLGEGAIQLDTTSQGWIQGFIENVGIELAQTLLAGVGQVDGWKPHHPPTPRPRSSSQEKKKKKQNHHSEKTSSIKKTTTKTNKISNHYKNDQTKMIKEDPLQLVQSSTMIQQNKKKKLPPPPPLEEDDTTTNYAVGDQVYKKHKTSNTLRGPYTIEGIHPEDGTVTLRLSPKVSQTVDINDVIRRRTKTKLLLRKKQQK